ncbi:F-type conjugal transfer protein TrbF [Escherichia coli]|nr:F-type conjugal transfer protein TrbF [Escherichia coli]EGO4448059.1 F-type conjugal transfer protein TrbF [Escherichia coli]EGZ7448005.1 F-type conjugal transfer protein TrbF [Escherichia coli]EIE7696047.1 F-type conjugal transfer protein TrbF [Escherichia coli]
MNYQKYQRKLIMKEKRNDAELKNRKNKRDYDYERRVSDIYFDLFFVFVAAGTFLWVIMHSIFDACIDSWMADPKLLNFHYMWNILMYVIPYTLWAFAGGFLIVYVRNPLNELINGGGQDIPAETPYAPGEHIKGGQQ